MRTLPEWLFDFVYFPILFDPIKDDFISWYRKAAEHPHIVDEVDISHPDLTTMALEAESYAKDIENEHELIQFFDTLEEIKNRLETLYSYILVVLFIVGVSLAGVSQTLTGLLMSRILLYSGIGMCGLVVLAISLYRIFKHQIRSNTRFMSLLNDELAVKPGYVRRYDRDLPGLLSAYLWNRSLSRPIVINVVLLLVIVRVLSRSMYGDISAEIQYSMHEFIEEDTHRVIKKRLSDLVRGEYLTNRSSLEKHPNEFTEKEIDQLRDQ
ncbi:hypothetical protein [Halorubrum sp. Boch-26]|uniref:hypothetical protein n=1 Tax=Halorubrum sp. Boch-26 TaxID=2994426 RepID=UPI002468B1FD|nr:hypothetical protein [Halorubrum sp. Boch-26]